MIRGHVSSAPTADPTIGGHPRALPCHSLRWQVAFCVSVLRREDSCDTVVFLHRYSVFTPRPTERGSEFKWAIKDVGGGGGFPNEIFAFLPLLNQRATRKGRWCGAFLRMRKEQCKLVCCR